MVMSSGKDCGVPQGSPTAAHGTRWPRAPARNSARAQSPVNRRRLVVPSTFMRASPRPCTLTIRHRFVCTAALASATAPSRSKPRSAASSEVRGPVAGRGGRGGCGCGRGGAAVGLGGSGPRSGPRGTGGPRVAGGPRGAGAAAGRSKARNAASSESRAAGGGRVGAGGRGGRGGAVAAVGRGGPRATGWLRGAGGPRGTGGRGGAVAGPGGHRGTGGPCTVGGPRGPCDRGAGGRAGTARGAASPCAPGWKPPA